MERLAQTQLRPQTEAIQSSLEWQPQQAVVAVVAAVAHQTLEALVVVAVVRAITLPQQEHLVKALVAVQAVAEQPVVVVAVQALSAAMVLDRVVLAEQERRPQSQVHP